MDKDMQKLLLLGGLVGATFLAFNLYTREKERKNVISLQQTQKLAQEIKQQMLVVTLKFAEGTKNSISKLGKESTKEQAELIDYFTTKMSEMYEMKQKLILSKYDISKEQFKIAFEKYGADKKLTTIQGEIIEMMERAVRGELPDLTVPKKASNAYGKVQVRRLYQEMSKMILIALTNKLREEKKKDPSFDSNDNETFAKAVREINAFERKKKHLKAKGFQQEWGCPNEIFFKLAQTQKLKDEKFRNEMKELQEIYDMVVEQIAKDPIAFRIESIDQRFSKPSSPSEKDNKFLSRSAIDRESEPTVNLNKSTRSEPEDKDENEDRLADDIPDEAPNPNANN